ncbi:hypothetical protein V8E55_004607 [Tylopilus felleus]
MQDTQPEYSSDDKELNSSPFSSVRIPPDLLFTLVSAHEPSNPPIQIARTRSLRAQLTPTTTSQKVLDMLNYMDSIGLNLPIFLDLLSWGNQACIENRKINYEWTSTSPRAEGASHIVECFTFDCVTSAIKTELEQVSETMRCPADELSTEGLTGLQIEDLILKLSSPGFHGILKFWSLLRLTIEKSRSDQNSHFVKLITTFLHSQGTPAKSLDLLRAFDLTMSHQWSNCTLNQISANEMQMVQQMVQTLPFVITHDNINIPFCSHFDSGTASIVFFQPNAPPEPPLSNRMLQEFRAQGRKSPLSIIEIFDFANAAAPSQLKRDVYCVLHYLLNSPDFQFSSYPHHNHSIFTPPPSINQLPIGDAHVISSYDGNDQVMQAIIHQLGLDSVEKMQKTGLERVIVWVGDQLTIEFLCWLYKFHAQDCNSYDRLDWLIMAFANSLHKQYLGTTAGRGLMHAFTLLERKGLQSVKTAGPFYQNLHDAIVCVAEAHFRACWKVVRKVDQLSDLQTKSPEELYALAMQIVQSLAASSSIEDIDLLPEDQQDKELQNTILWNLMEQSLPHLAFRFVGGGNSKYTIEVLELLQELLHEWPPEVCDFVRCRCWLVNMTGQPLDLLKSHSPAIPMLQAICKHMEHQVSSLHKEKDIQWLENSYQSSQVHSKQKGRELRHRSDMVVDLVSAGAGKLTTKKKRELVGLEEFSTSK